MSDKQVDRRAERRICRNPGITVRPPTLESDDQVAGGHGLPGKLVCDRQHFPDSFDPTPDCADRATGFLDSHRGKKWTRRKVLAGKQIFHLVNLAPKSDHQYPAEINVPRIARERATQDL